MNFWIYRDNRQQGPFSYEQLEQMGLTPKTPVWYEGLANWQDAGKAPLTRSLFEGNGEGGFSSYTEVSAAGEGQNAQGEQKTPPTYLFWAIFSTLCCCLPLGIASIFTSARTRSRINSGDMAGAQKMSEISAWLIMISITFGVVSLPFTLMMYL